MRPINGIIIHCSATPPDWMADATGSERVAEIKRWHVKERGWSDIGYHILIDRDGGVLYGRPIGVVGAHTSGHNGGTIGICLIGGKGAKPHDKFFDHFTREQDEELRERLEELGNFYDIEFIRGHNEFAAKGCPGFQVREWLVGSTGKAETAPDPISAPEPPKGLAAILAFILNAILNLFGGGK